MNKTIPQFVLANARESFVSTISIGSSFSDLEINDEDDRWEQGFGTTNIDFIAPLQQRRKNDLKVSKPRRRGSMSILSEEIEESIKSLDEELKILENDFSFSLTQLKNRFHPASAVLPKKPIRKGSIVETPSISAAAPLNSVPPPRPPIRQITGERLNIIHAPKLPRRQLTMETSN